MAIKLKPYYCMHCKRFKSRSEVIWPEWGRVYCKGCHEDVSFTEVILSQMIAERANDDQKKTRLAMNDRSEDVTTWIEHWSLSKGSSDSVYCVKCGGHVPFKSLVDTWYDYCPFCGRKVLNSDEYYK